MIRDHRILKQAPKMADLSACKCIEKLGEPVATKPRPLNNTAVLSRDVRERLILVQSSLSHQSNVLPCYCLAISTRYARHLAICTLKVLIESCSRAPKSCVSRILLLLDKSNSYELNYFSRKDPCPCPRRTRTPQRLPPQRGQQQPHHQQRREQQHHQRERQHRRRRGAP